MLIPKRSIQLTSAIFIIASWLTLGQANDDRDTGPRRNPPTTPSGPFSPSNARTEDGGLISIDQFFPASRCASCHRDTHTAWSQSLHRNAGREPFYKESVDILLHAQGTEFTRHCESCHAPTSLLSGALTKGSTVPRAMDDEGVTCSVCHSITEARLDGTGSYTIRRPSLVAREDGTPIYGDVSDDQILADIPGHRRAVMRPLLRKPEFCATCHKSSAPPELNGYKMIRGFSAYDEWQQSGASHETVTPFYKRAERTECTACHMTKVPSLDDRASKNGVISSHRWLGANTAAPLVYGQMEQVEATEQFLKSNVLSVDIFSIIRESTGEQLAPLGREESLQLRPGEEITVEVVVANRNAAHSFPPELRDLYEAWVEFEAIDASGKTIFHSGFLQPDKTLDESAHVYRAVFLDEQGRMITRHQMWLAMMKAYDNAIGPGRSDLVRFRFRMPEESTKDGSPTLTLRARVNYRRFVQEYTDFALIRSNSGLTVPVVLMAEAILYARNSGSVPVSVATYPAAIPTSLARRWNDYGIGLLEQAQYGPAAEAFRHGSQLDGTDPNLLINAAIAEMRTERYGPEREQLIKAAELLDRALMIAPAQSRANFYRAIVFRGRGKPAEAVEILGGLAQMYPRDREVQRQLGQTLYVLNRIAEARKAFEAILGIDPTDAGAYQFLAPIYEAEGRKNEANRARSLYLEWRDDPAANRIAGRFFATHPQWSEERVGSHVHRRESPTRPVLTGQSAAP